MADSTVHEREEWRTIPFAPDYEVSSVGRVRSIPRVSTFVRYGETILRKYRGGVLKPDIGVGGYRRVLLRVDQEPTRHLVHRLVLRVFVGEPRHGQEARHLNGDPSDNRVVNLRWGTHAENLEDRVRHGNNPAGERNPRAILSEADVRDIRKSLASNRELAERYGIHPGYASAIRTGSAPTWQHVK